VKEIRIHGRGRQGSVVLVELIALAAWEDGKSSQAFPFLGGGGERRGKPIQAFAWIDIQGYLWEVRHRRSNQAWKIIMEENPFLSVSFRPNR
jgi:Pyruvate/2-oxoacid:ferredoxin oxidoreductase gamma subunit